MQQLYVGHMLYYTHTYLHMGIALEWIFFVTAECFMSGKKFPQKQPESVFLPWNGFAIKLTTLVNFLMFQSQSIYKYFTYDKTRTEFLDLNQLTRAVTFSM